MYFDNIVKKTSKSKSPIPCNIPNIILEELPTTLYDMLFLIFQQSYLQKNISSY